MAGDQTLLAIYADVSKFLTENFPRIADGIQSPDFIETKIGYVFQYKTLSLEAAIVQKCARMVSGLNASLVLIQAGHTQELGVVLRTLDEFAEDIAFLCQGLGDGNLTDLHRRYLSDFYSPDFTDVTNPMNSMQKRQRVERKKIQAAISNDENAPLNPSDFLAVIRTTGAHSGFVHGSSERILEMYGGNPPAYHLKGMLGTPRVPEYIQYLFHYYYRGLVHFALVAMHFGVNDLFAECRALRDKFEKESGNTEWDRPEEIIRSLKAKQKT